MDPNTQQQSVDTPQQIAPQPIQPNTTGNGPTSINNKKIAIIVGSVLGVMLVIGLVVIAVKAFSISKADYYTAYDTTQTNAQSAGNAEDAIQALRINSYDSKSKVETNVETAEKKIADYKASMDKVAKLKALGNKDIKTAYDSYKTTYDSYLSAAEKYVASAKKALPAVAECESISSSGVSDLASFQSAIAPCKTALNNVGTVDDRDLKDFIDAYKKSVNDTESAVALVANNPGQRNTAVSDIYKAQNELVAAQRKTNDAITKRFSGDKSQDTVAQKFVTVVKDIYDKQ